MTLDYCVWRLWIIKIFHDLFSFIDKPTFGFEFDIHNHILPQNKTTAVLVCGSWRTFVKNQLTLFSIYSTTALLKLHIVLISRELFAYVIAKFFQGGYRTKMKIWSENFSPAAGFFRCGGTENRKKNR